MTWAVQIHNLNKTFKGWPALDALNFSIPDKAVAAFIGANGAGKTTTFSILAGFLKPDSGDVRIYGESLKDFRRKGGILGFLPQDSLFVEQRSVERHLALLARLAGYFGSRLRTEVQRVLNSVQLEDRADDLISQLSHGMKVRFGIAQALVGNPPVVLLDEPTAGLDPKMVALLRSTIERLRGQTTIMISSHDLSQLQVLCDYLVIIDSGQVVREGEMAEVLRSSSISFYLDNSMPDLNAMEQFFPEFQFSARLGSVLEVQFDANTFQVPEVNSRVLFWLFRHGAKVVGVESHQSLEELYLRETHR